MSGIWYQSIDENSCMLEKTIEKYLQYTEKVIFNVEIINLNKI